MPFHKDLRRLGFKKPLQKQLTNCLSVPKCVPNSSNPTTTVFHHEILTIYSIKPRRNVTFCAKCSIVYGIEHNSKVLNAERNLKIFKLGAMFIQSFVCHKVRTLEISKLFILPLIDICLKWKREITNTLYVRTAIKNYIYGTDPWIVCTQCHRADFICLVGHTNQGSRCKHTSTGNT